MVGLIIFLVVLISIDFYVYQPVKIVLRKRKKTFRRVAKVIYWLIPLVPLILMPIYNSVEDFDTGRTIRYWMLSFFSVNYIPKLFITLVLVFYDILHFFNWIIKKMTLRRDKQEIAGKPISRGEFISKASLIAGAAPLAAMGFGIIKGAHDYRVRHVKIPMPSLPKEFHGIRIAQVSDIHSGSFFNKKAVLGGVDMLLGEKPDVIFFTGDLVNDTTKEVEDYIPVFNKLKADLGVFSVTGNHDYGDYANWSSAEAKKKNFEDLITAHKQMGYDLLLNESRYLEVDGERIAVIGVENWGAGRFQKYGDLDKAYASVKEEVPVKLLLSHDPSHWDAQVRPNYQDIDVMFAGHTHGFQFGVEIGNFKWSPSQYIYKQWADLYKEDNQYLYVNRGFGFIGYPGRIGINPEITIFELTKA